MNQREFDVVLPRIRTGPEPTTPPRRNALDRPTSDVQPRPGFCGATRRDGQLCLLPVRDGGDGRHCWAHDSSLDRARAEGRRRGGFNRATIARARNALPASLQELADRLTRAMDAVERGEMSPGAAGALSALARSYISVIETNEMTGIAQRVAVLERASREKSR